MKIKSILSVIALSVFTFSTAFADKPVAISKADGPNSLEIGISVDVGKGQLAWKLRNNPKIFPIEGLNARYEFSLPNYNLVDLIVIDVSFISAKLIIENCLKFLKTMFII